MRVYVLTEPAYKDSIWCNRVMNGIKAEIARKKYSLTLIDGERYRDTDCDELFQSGGSRLIIVIGTAILWTTAVQSFFSSISGVSLILICGAQPPEYISVRGVVRVDYLSITHRLLHYLYFHGRSRIALFGFNPDSYADCIKARYFLSWSRENAPGSSEGDIYHNHADLGGCFDAFFKNVGRYDGVLCANELVAPYLLKRLTDSGVRVPEDLFITCVGDSPLLELIRPGITSAVLGHEEVGRQAVAIYAYLYRQPAEVSTSILVGGQLMVRESTAMLPVPEDLTPIHMSPIPAPLSPPPVNFFSDSEVRRLSLIENLVSKSDQLDKQILMGILSGKTYESLAETLNTAVSTLRYRLRRMLSATDIASRNELLLLLEQYNLLEAGEPRD